MTTQKIQCEHCSSIVRKDNFKQHQRTKKCQKAQEEKRQKEQEEKRQKEQQSPVKERKERKEEKIECKWCGTKVFEKHLQRHYDTKKCMKVRILKEPSNLYKCKWCKQCFPSHEELDIHRDVCLKAKIYHLKQELYIEKENNNDLVEQHKFELKEQEKELMNELKEQQEKFDKKLTEKEQQYKNEMKEQAEKLRREMREREQELKDELKSKDDFIKTLAKEPKYVTNTNNHNTFNLNNYFKGNNGIDFDEKSIEKKIEQCRDMMLDTINKYGFSDMKKIRDVKEKQIDLLCKDEKTKKWNVINTDASRKTYTICKRDNDKVIIVKDPDGKMIKTVVGEVDKSNRRSFCGVLAKNVHLQGSMFRELEDKYDIVEKEKLLKKIPSKGMVSEKEKCDDEDIINIE